MAIDMYSLIPDFITDSLTKVTNFISSVLGVVIQTISSIFSFIFEKLFFVVDWISYFIGWITWSYQWFFFILLALEAIVIVISLRSDNVFESLISNHVYFYGILINVVFTVIKFLWGIVRDILKIITGMIPFT